MEAQIVSRCIKCADPLIHRLLPATGEKGVLFLKRKRGVRFLVCIEILHEDSFRTLDLLKTLREAGAECQGSRNIIFTSIHQSVTDPMETFCRIGRAEREENSFQIINLRKIRFDNTVDIAGSAHILLEEQCLFETISLKSSLPGNMG